jgi:hypothetical protein
LITSVREIYTNRDVLLLGTEEGKLVFWSKSKEKALYFIQFAKSRIEDVILIESPFAVKKSNMV